MKLSLLLISVLFCCCSVFSQNVVPFTIRHQVNQKGGLVMLSNVSVDCGGCAANNEVPPGGNGNNNSFSASYTDIDNDGSTFMSSSDQLDLSSCSEITWAGLYWSGLVNQSNPSNTQNYNLRNQVKIAVDGGGYQNLTADDIIDNTVNKNSYYCFKDVTTIVQENQIDSEYTVANVVTQTGNNTFGGWTLVVVYRDIYASMRNITVFNGLSNISIGATTTTDISGFLTPPSGAVEFELGVVAHDGDRGDTGDQLSFNGTGSFVNISDAIHPISNSFNSTISSNGVLTPNRNPSYNNNLGYDASIYIPDNSTLNYLGNSATSAQIKISSASESVLASVISSVVDIYEPDLRASVTYTDLNGGTVLPGDVLEYKIVSKNIGSDVSLNTFLTDTLDERLNYITGSMNVTFGPNAGVKTDAVDTDQAEFIAADNLIKLRLGTGADGITGGALNNSSTGADSVILTFQVELENDCPIWQCGSVLENKAYLFGTGQISGITNGNNGASDLLDENGCPSLESGIVNIDISACADTVINHTDSLCVGELLSLDFPNSGFLTYQWTGPNGFSANTNNPTIPDVQLINAGDYVLHVYYQGEECITDTTAPVFVSDNPTIILNEIKNDSCFNLNEGFINVSGVGNAPFSYLWSNNDADSLAQNIGVGNYTVTATDPYGCMATESYTITEPSELTVTTSIISDYNGSPISCFNATDGSAALTATGGVGPYSYLWSQNAEINDTLFNLSTGNYTVIVTDNNGCEINSSVMLTAPDTIIITANIIDIPCFDDTTGSIDVTITGGTLPYTSSWSNTDITEDLINEPAGVYTDTVIDLNGCIGLQEFTIEQPLNPVVLNTTTTLILCAGDSTGNIDLSVSGGVEPYSYLWSTGNTSQDLMDFPQGIYSVTVTDFNNCVQTIEDTIYEIAQLVITETHLDPVCQNGTQGSIDLTVIGGTPNYSFVWNNGESSEDISNLYDGDYNCVVSDQNNCTDTIVITITDPDAVEITEIHTDVLCYDSLTGVIDITVANGTPDYTYNWSTTAITEDVSNLAAGPYWLDVVDVNGCGAFMSFNIQEPDTAIYVSSVVLSHVLCNGDNIGAIDLEVEGGTPNYTYLWSNTAITQDLTTLSAGSYNVAITDANACVINYETNITEPTVLSLTETHIDVLCFGQATGEIDVTTTGGVASYTYLWNTTSTNEDLNNILAGNYFLTVTDFNNCTDTISIRIDEPNAPLSLFSNMLPVLCFDGNDGSVEVIATNGTPGYTYQWQHDFTTDSIVENLEEGTYTITVTDNHGCEETLATQVTQPSAPISLVTTGSEICFGETTGTASVLAQGGTPGYFYLWSTNALDTLDSITELGIDGYSVTVTDINGCFETADVNILISNNPECVVLDMPNIFTPNNDNQNDIFIPRAVFSIKEFSITILNRWGNLMYKSDDYTKGWKGTNLSGKDAEEGVYFWTINYTDIYGVVKRIQGNVTLKR